MDLKTELIRMRTELDALIQAKRKSSGTLKTYFPERYYTSFEWELYNPYLYPIVRSSDYIVITVESTNGLPFFADCFCELRNKEDDPTRFIYCTHDISEDGATHTFYVRARSLNEDDLARVETGETVYVSVYLSIVTTTPVTVTRTREDLYPE